MLLFRKFITGRFALFIILCTATTFATFLFWSQRTRWTIPETMLNQTGNWAQITPDFDKATYRVFNAAKKFRAEEIAKIAEDDDHLAGKLAEFAALDCNAPSQESRLFPPHRYGPGIRDFSKIRQRTFFSCRKYLRVV